MFSPSLTSNMFTYIEDRRKQAARQEVLQEVREEVHEEVLP